MQFTMSTSEKGVLTNPPKVLKIKSLAAIYAAEDARKAASFDSPSKFPGEFSCTISNIKSEPINFEEIYSSFGSEENDLETSRWGALDVSLKDLRARCKATKKRKADAKPKETDDLDEPLIVFKAKRSKSSYAVRSKITVAKVISECLVVQGSKGERQFRALCSKSADVN